MSQELELDLCGSAYYEEHIKAGIWWLTAGDAITGGSKD